MKHVKFDLHTPLGKLSLQRDSRYSYAEISDKSGLSRQGVRRMLTEPTKQLDVATIEKLINFFESEGMPIGIEQLFTVTEEPQP